jgi:predicted nucleic acid-binding protein
VVDGKVLLPLVWRYGLTAYNAAYLELAKRKGLPLATFDKELIAAAKLEGIDLIG